VIALAGSAEFHSFMPWTVIQAAFQVVTAGEAVGVFLRLFLECFEFAGFQLQLSFVHFFSPAASAIRLTCLPNRF
jgi:hypothetical protein